MADLDPGDHITVGVTLHTWDRGRELWPKAEVTVVVREGETGHQAAVRADAALQEFLLGVHHSSGNTSNNL